jgi:RHS repeat-associated protein
VVTNFTYSVHDPVGNRMSRGGSTAPTETYGYDALDRLTSVTRVSPSETYTYDAVGNRSTSPPTVPSWTYDDWNELTSNSNAAFEYDANGNLTQKTEGGVAWGYEWDAANQLKRVTKGGQEISRYTYDALGRRTELVTSAPVVRRTFTYDGEDILLDGRGLNAATANTYVHGPGLDEPLSVEKSTGAVSYYHADALGSIVRSTNATGAVVASESRQYDAFGNLQSGQSIEGYAYTGREWEPAAGLSYHRARYYDPRIGRFISEDPIGFRGGINFYAYVLDNPVNLIDPTGHMGVWNRFSKNFRRACVAATTAGAIDGLRLAWEWGQQCSDNAEQFCQKTYPVTWGLDSFGRTTDTKNDDRLRCIRQNKECCSNGWHLGKVAINALANELVDPAVGAASKLLGGTNDPPFQLPRCEPEPIDPWRP